VASTIRSPPGGSSRIGTSTQRDTTIANRSLSGATSRAIGIFSPVSVVCVSSPFRTFGLRAMFASV
jgi:hypothetical protein